MNILKKGYPSLDSGQMFKEERRITDKILTSLHSTNAPLVVISSKPHIYNRSVTLITPDVAIEVMKGITGPTFCPCAS